SGLDWAGFIGGSGEEEFVNIAVEGGNIYVTGATSSTAKTFPGGDGFGTLGGPDTSHNGGYNDAFVAKVKADGSGLDWAGYIGGEGGDGGDGLAAGGGGWG